jgi:hypothetical protein
LRELAETLIDLGTNDMQLVIGVASLNELEDDLRRNENDRERTEAEMAHVEQSARERESSLRFALGELCFLRSQTEGAASPDLQRQIGALEQRLAAMAGERAADVNDLTERAIALAAERAGIEDRLEAVSASVERIVVALAVAHLANETVQAGLQRIQRARAAADRAANRE